VSLKLSFGSPFQPLAVTGRHWQLRAARSARQLCVCPSVCLCVCVMYASRKASGVIERHGQECGSARTVRAEAKPVRESPSAADAL